MSSVYQIREFGVITVGNDARTFNSNELEIDEFSFNDLINFIESNESAPDFDKAFSIFRKNGKRCIRVKNYVGVIETRSGVVIEILPKVYASEVNATESASMARTILLRLLQSLDSSPFISLGDAHLKESENLPLFEVFISTYLDELTALISRGLKGGYVTHQGSLNFLKGKLLMGETLKINQINQAQFHCEYDDFNQDVPPNRLIKSTLNFLLREAKSNSNKKKALKAIQSFELIRNSASYDNDFRYCAANKKLLSNYESVILWSKIFLKKKALMSFHGDTLNKAILFPMERLFESYISALIKRYCKDFFVKTQDRRFSLIAQMRSVNDFNYSLNKFNLRPDIVLNNNQIILDTKWKVLDVSSYKYGIQESDIYQMHAYGRKYKNDEDDVFPRLGLIYPKCDSFKEKLLQMRYGKGLLLDVIPFDLVNKDQGEEIRSVISNFIN